MKTFKAALFDLDGTLFDTESQYTVFWGRVGRKYHPEIPDFAHRIKGTTLKDILGRYFQDESAHAGIIRELYDWETQMQYAFFPGAEELLKDLRSHGVKVALVTSSNQEKMRHVWEQMPRFPQHFDRILTSEDFAASKPHPDCYLKGAEACGCQPKECVVFEDAFTGLDAGMAAGMFTFGFTSSLSRAEIQSRCSFVLESFVGLDYEKICRIAGLA